MSVWGIRDFTNWIPGGDFRSTAMEDLCRVRRSFVGVRERREEGETVRSRRRTEAPLSARRRPANGPMEVSIHAIK